MKTIVALILASVLLVGSAVAQAGLIPIVAVSYSDPEEIYGWCASDGGDPVTCANNACVAEGGTACTDKPTCALAYTVIAFTRESARGMAIACENNPIYARMGALAACTLASHATCWTREVISITGETTSAEDNLALDRLVYMQMLLQGMEATKTVIGRETTAELLAPDIKAFQARVDIPATGLADALTLEAMFTVFDGEHGLLKFLTTNKPAIYADVASVAGESSAPSPDRPFDEEIASYPLDRQDRVLTMFLNFYGYPCASPATAITADAETWQVNCATGKDYAVNTDDTGWSVTTYATPLPDSPAADTPASPQKVVPRKEKRK